MKWKKYTDTFVLIAFLICIGCSAAAPVFAAPSDAQENKNPARIVSVTTQGDDAAAELVITLSSPVIFTSYKNSAPLRYIIDFSQVVLGDVAVPIAVNRGNFKSVTAKTFDTGSGMLTRMEIELVDDREALISTPSAEPGRLKISFPRGAENSAAVQKALPAEPAPAPLAPVVPVVPVETPAAVVDPILYP